jgi:hypothetical protein
MMSSVEPMSSRSGVEGNVLMLVLLEMPALLPLRGGACEQNKLICFILYEFISQQTVLV